MVKITPKQHAVIALCALLFIGIALGVTWYKTSFHEKFSGDDIEMYDVGSEPLTREEVMALKAAQLPDEVADNTTAENMTKYPEDIFTKLLRSSNSPVGGVAEFRMENPFSFPIPLEFYYLDDPDFIKTEVITLFHTENVTTSYWQTNLNCSGQLGNGSDNCLPYQEEGEYTALKQIRTPYDAETGVPTNFDGIVRMESTFTAKMGLGQQPNTDWIPGVNVSGDVLTRLDWAFWNQSCNYAIDVTIEPQTDSTTPSVQLEFNLTGATNIDHDGIYVIDNRSNQEVEWFNFTPFGGNYTVLRVNVDNVSANKPFQLEVDYGCGATEWDELSDVSLPGDGYDMDDTATVNSFGNSSDGTWAVSSAEYYVGNGSMANTVTVGNKKQTINSGTERNISIEGYIWADNDTFTGTDQMYFGFRNGSVSSNDPFLTARLYGPAGNNANWGLRVFKTEIMTSVPFPLAPRWVKIEFKINDSTVSTYLDGVFANSLADTWIPNEGQLVMNTYNDDGDVPKLFDAISVRTDWGDYNPTITLGAEKTPSTPSNNTRPTQDLPILNSSGGNNLTDDNLTLSPQNVQDPDSDAVTNITRWRVNGQDLFLMNYAFDTNHSNATEADIIRDYSGQDHNGTGGGGDSNHTPTWKSENCIDGGCFYFDGNGDYIDNGNVLDGKQSVTVSYWVNVNTTTSKIHTPFFEQLTLYSEIRPGGSVRVVAYNESGAFHILDSATGVITANTWHHVLVTVNFTGGYLAISVDGCNTSCVNLTVAGTRLNTHSGVFMMGKGIIADRGMNGTLDNLKVWNRTVTSGQSKTEYLKRSNVIDSSMTESGDVWQACNIPNDGWGDGPENCSINLTLNSVPTQPTITQPTNNSYTNNKTVAWNASTDGDNDALNYTVHVSMYSNFSVINFSNSTVNISQYTIDNLTEGEWHVRVRAYDGKENSSWSTAVNFTYYVPTTVNVTLTSSSSLNLTNGTLTATFAYKTTSPYGATINETAWYVDGTLNTTFANLTIIGSGNTTKGEEWSFWARSYDGSVWTAWETANLTINNQGPTTPDLKNPPDGYQLYNLTANLGCTNSTDLDGDTIYYEFWNITGGYNVTIPSEGNCTGYCDNASLTYDGNFSTGQQKNFGGLSATITENYTVNVGSTVEVNWTFRYAANPPGAIFTMQCYNGTGFMRAFQNTDTSGSPVYQSVILNTSCKDQNPIRLRSVSTVANPGGYVTYYESALTYLNHTLLANSTSDSYVWTLDENATYNWTCRAHDQAGTSAYATARSFDVNTSRIYDTENSTTGLYAGYTHTFDFNASFYNATVSNVNVTFYFNNTYINTHEWAANYAQGRVYANATHVPTLVPSNITHTYVWQLHYTDVNGSNYRQNYTYTKLVVGFNVTICETGQIVLNATIYNETTRLVLNQNATLQGSFTFWNDDKDVNFTVLFDRSSNHVYLCMPLNDSTYNTDAQLHYYTPNSPLRSHYLLEQELNGTVTELVYLYLLPDGTNTQIFVYDTTETPQTDKYIQVLRYYPELATYQLVAMGLTDDDGQDIIPMEYNDVWYIFKVVDYPTTELFSSLPRKVSESPQYINIVSRAYSTILAEMDDVAYGLSFNNLTNVFRLSFDTGGNIREMCLKVLKVRKTGTNQLCDTCSSASAGIITCTITNDTATYIASAYGKKNPLTLYDSITVVYRSVEELFAQWDQKESMLVGLMFLGTTTFLFLFSPGMAIAGAIVGLIGITFMNIAPISLLLIMVAVIVGFIIMYKAKR